MQLMPAADVPALGPERTFGYPAARAAVTWGALFGAGVALIALGRIHQAPVAYFVAAVLLAVLFLSRRIVLARLEPTNWLARVGDEGLFVKFRSYLNHHLPERSPTVVFIPYREIRCARLVREWRDVPESSGSEMTRQRRVLVELELRQDAPELQQALAAERRVKAPKVPRWYGSSSTLYRHYPVRMPSTRGVEVEWNAAPSAREILRVLAAHCDVEALDVAKDFTRIKQLDRQAQEAQLQELAETGQEMTATRLARSLYGYSLRDAECFVAGLVGAKRP